ncbi:uncharacterized protein LOC9636819 isoform X2 [Selaginella moellendorffii]|uniref:uncharacterized protein LOC9636819 isoform X2 n=1 Tax=Selaginella moellendorffii TaxID=88036 RepID=UPI000D1CB4A5|nr:uncharacterized protein LOC9636819 isoform X2 [Selaginella moellendorffii]|eukprot:XP_024533500.1 uncharacterized protein LOC9636819 isoform X2 [Selaginella moellendorffii]
MEGDVCHLEDWHGYVRFAWKRLLSRNFDQCFFVSSMESVDVAIIGAGLCGLALAIGLQNRGITAHLFEKSDGIRADTATGISIGKNGGRALDGIHPGLEEAMKSAGTQIKSFRILDITGGEKQEIEMKEGEIPAVFMVPWRKARKMLADMVPSSNVHCSHKLVSYSAAKDKDEVELEFEVRDDQGRTSRKTIHADLVIGTDGVHSAVRKIMVGDKPRDLHLMNWNALVYNPDSKFFKVHEKDQIFMIKDHATFVHLADSGEDYTLWVVRMHNEDIPTGGAFGGPPAKERALKEIRKLEPPEVWEPLRIAVEATSPELIYERRIIDNPPLESWSDLDGRVLLIGDAAHAMHWGPGQGARTAFEDAHQLSELLAAAIATGEERKRAIARFEELRIPRMTRFQAFAAEGTELPEFVTEDVQTLPESERRKRRYEFQAWADSYPEKMAGDPDSTYFKPL